MKRIIGAVLVAGVLTGCSTTRSRVPDTTGTAASDFPIRKSAALMVAEAAGIDGLRDIRADVFEKGRAEAARQNKPPGSILNGISGPGLAIGGYITPPPGFTPGAALGLGLLSWLSTPAAPPPARFTTRTIAWLPAEAAASRETADAWLTDQFQAAVFRAMRLTGMVQRDGVFRPLLGPETKFTVWARPDCPPVTEGRRETYHDSCSGLLNVQLNDAGAERLARLGAPPAVLGLPATDRGPVLVLPKTSGMFRQWLTPRDHLRALSKELPPAFVIYLPPTPAELPAVLHGDEEWQFVAPQR